MVSGLTKFHPISPLVSHFLPHSFPRSSEPITSAVAGGLVILVASFVFSVFLGGRKRQVALEQGGLTTSESLHV
jgi:hypothetical protein